MSLTSLSVKDLPKIGRLLEQKERYQHDINEINRQLASFEIGAKPAAPPSRTKATKAPRSASAPRRGGRRAKRGELQESIPRELKTAGKAGLHVKEIAKRIGAKESNIRIWFYRSGAKIRKIKQVAPATYAWKG